MKHVIPKGKTVEKLNGNTISTKYIDINKIIVVTRRTIYKTDELFMLVQTAELPGKWHLASLTHSVNHLYRGNASTPCEILDEITYKDDHIYQFEDPSEFVQWLSKNIS